MRVERSVLLNEGVLETDPDGIVRRKANVERQMEVHLTACPPIGFESGVRRHYGLIVRTPNEMEGSWNRGEGRKPEHFDPEYEAKCLVAGLLASIPGATIDAVLGELVRRRPMRGYARAWEEEEDDDAAPLPLGRY